MRRYLGGRKGGASRGDRLTRTSDTVDIESGGDGGAAGAVANICRAGATCVASLLRVRREIFGRLVRCADGVQWVAMSVSLACY